jgi:hypothetical protein
MRAQQSQLDVQTGTFFFDRSHLRITSSSALANPDSFPLEGGRGD